MFGPKVIGQEAYDAQKELVDEGRLHFGKKVIGEGTLKKSIHGQAVVGENEAAVQLATATAAGRPAELDDLKLAELEEVCESMGLSYPKKSAKAKLVEIIRGAAPAEVEPEPEPEPAGPPPELGSAPPEMPAVTEPVSDDGPDPRITQF